MGSLAQSIKDAKASIRKHKNSVPWMFVEYQSLQHARVKYREARREYERALKKWNDLGK